MEYGTRLIYHIASHGNLDDNHLLLMDSTLFTHFQLWFHGHDETKQYNGIA